MLIFILLGINPSGRQIFQSADPVERNAEVKVQLLQEYGAIPMHFEKNMGQTDEGVKFISSGQGYTLFLTSTEAVLSLRKSETEEWRPETGDRKSVLGRISYRLKIRNPKSAIRNQTSFACRS